MAGFVVLVGAFEKESFMAGFPILFAGLGSLLAAHILRLLEKTAHNAEKIQNFWKSLLTKQRKISAGSWWSGDGLRECRQGGFG